MKTIKLENREYNFPTSWKEVSFDKYLAINKVDEINDMYKIAKFVSILSGIEYEKVLEIPFSEFNKIPIDWMIKVEDKVQNEWIINDIKYCISLNLNQMTTAEYMDTVTFSKSIDTFDKLIAIILRPEGEKYSSVNLEARAKLLRNNLNGNDVYNITNFFLTGEMGLFESLTTFLQKIQKEEKTEKEMMDGE